MRTRFTFLAAAILLGCGPQAVSAQDVTTSFRGFRVEGNVGWDKSQALGEHNNKLGYGGTVGFDGLIGDKIVIGPEASFWRATNGSQNCAAGVVGGSVCTKSFGEWGAAVRAGYLVTPQVLVFAKGGYAADEQRKRFDAPAGEASFYNHYHTDGYQVGGGVEYTVGNRFSGLASGLYVSGQYVYANYNDHTSRQRAMLGVGIRFK